MKTNILFSAISVSIFLSGSLQNRAWAESPVVSNAQEVCGGLLGGRLMTTLLTRVARYFPSRSRVYQGVAGPMVLFPNMESDDARSFRVDRPQFVQFDSFANEYKRTFQGSELEAERLQSEIELLRYMVRLAKESTFSNHFFVRYDEATMDVETFVDQRPTGIWALANIAPSSGWSYRLLKMMRSLGFMLSAKPEPGQKFEKSASGDWDRGFVTRISPGQLSRAKKLDLISRIYYRPERSSKGKWYWPEQLDEKLWVPVIEFSQEMVEYLLANDSFDIGSALIKMREVYATHFPAG